MSRKDMKHHSTSLTWRYLEVSFSRSGVTGRVLAKPVEIPMRDGKTGERVRKGEWERDKERESDREWLAWGDQACKTYLPTCNTFTYVSFSHLQGCWCFGSTEVNITIHENALKDNKYVIIHHRWGRVWSLTFDVLTRNLKSAKKDWLLKSVSKQSCCVFL